jgi:hypothetical protein
MRSSPSFPAHGDGFRAGLQRRLIDYPALSPNMGLSKPFKRFAVSQTASIWTGGASVDGRHFSTRPSGSMRLQRV